MESYYLQAKTEKIDGKGTIDENTYYRGTVIADAMAAVEINGGSFTAKSNGEFYDELYKATVTFKNVPESWSGTYTVGYKLMNDLGEVSFNPENTLPFTLSIARPEIVSFIETQSCIEGENMTFSFEAENIPCMLQDIITKVHLKSLL